MVSTELKRVSELNRTEKAAIIIQALEKAGYNQNQAANLLQVSRQRVCQVNAKIKKGTLNPLVNKAKKAVKQILAGELVGRMDRISGGEILTAAKMVLDRSDPITIKTENTSLHTYVDLTPADRDRYKKALGIIDVEYELLPEIKQIGDSSNGRTEDFESLNVGSTPALPTISEIIENEPDTDTRTVTDSQAV